MCLESLLPEKPETELKKTNKKRNRLPFKETSACVYRNQRQQQQQQIKFRLIFAKNKRDLFFFLLD